ncbi:hypothetical protein [Duganella hordei]|uniref:hypothetical protein n=1 Tax=Duganella hordei TaxID=2865934 RepID=UPI00333EE50B
MKLDRELQRQLLQKFADIYPARGPAGKWEQSSEIVNANLSYLIEHNLIHAAAVSHPLSGPVMIANIAITAAGLDFLADDGGLTAILGTVTVKLHDDTIRNLIETRIQDSDLPPEEKTGLLHQLKELRGESIKHLTMKLLDAGLENLPAALPLIQKALGGLL